MAADVERGPTRVIDTTPGYTFPIGFPRFAKFDQAIDALKTGALRYTAMGDSISSNFNLCSAPETFWYSKRIRERLACTAPAASVTLDQAGVLGAAHRRSARGRHRRQRTTSSA